MGNDYKKGHDYRMQTDANYRKRHGGSMKTPARKRGQKCQRAGCGAYAKEYHHTSPGRGYWLCKKHHKAVHGGLPRGKTPHKN